MQQSQIRQIGIRPTAEYRKFTCKFCGNKFPRRDLSPSHMRRSTPKYCSRTCSSKARRKRIVVVCSNPNCMKLIEKRHCERKKHPCCDKFCAQQWIIASGIREGVNNFAWRGGISYRYRGENWEEQRQKSLERDHYTCQCCGLTKYEIEFRNLRALEVHHKKPFCLFLHYVEANSLDNLKTLCRVCHMIEEHQFIKAHPEEPTLRRIPKTTPLPTPCSDCNEIFQPSTHKRKACDKCMLIRCLNCGNDHRVEEHHMKRFQRFCSPECVTEYIGRNNRKIDQTILEEMKGLRDQGYSYNKIADELEFSKFAVRVNLISSYGFNAVERPTTHLDKALLEKMKGLKSQGLSSRKIATKLGIGKSTVARHLKPGKPFLDPDVQSRPVGKVDEAMLERLKALRNEGRSYTEIGLITGLHRKTVKRHLKSYQSPVPIAHPKRKITKEMLEDAQMFKNEGLSYAQIGLRLGVSPNAVWKCLRLLSSR